MNSSLQRALSTIPPWLSLPFKANLEICVPARPDGTPGLVLGWSASWQACPLCPAAPQWVCPLHCDLMAPAKPVQSHPRFPAGLAHRRQPPVHTPGSTGLA